MLPNSIGLAGAFLLLSGAFLACVWLGQRLAGAGGTLVAAGALVWSIAPIALAYHFSHYLISFTLNAQYALAAISDPLSRGWNLFGTAGYHVLAVVMAHVAAFRLHGNSRRAVVSQIPLVVLMVGYTVFGLWLLSSPTGF
jgi:hypothetical protein